MYNKLYCNFLSYIRMPKTPHWLRFEHWKWFRREDCLIIIYRTCGEFHPLPSTTPSLSARLNKLYLLGFCNPSTTGERIKYFSTDDRLRIMNNRDYGVFFIIFFYVCLKINFSQSGWWLTRANRALRRKHDLGFI